MAPFYKTAAAFCLAGLFGLQSVAATETKYKFETSEVKEEAYLTVRLARNGKITATTNDVARDEDVLAALQEKFVTENTAQEPTCAALINEKLKKVFHVSFSYTETPNYSTLVEGALKNGLEAFSEEYFNELIARQDKLKSMTKDDLKDPIVTSSASAAFPSILTAGLVAVVAAISA
ncbi:uncharacterized protein EMH_0003670 [Eimeria mitis]|uniref:SAG family member n=1 Tax=Eimeria mitis TaxID=44415 RepID=U6JXA6_9EIME|nr:uncharacterized protein EMH_0003670 [Eimeria mitis]CDJ29366.1 hypothetical protein EMH_0003670 [Eimeria mitis]